MNELEKRVTGGVAQVQDTIADIVCDHNPHTPEELCAALGNNEPKAKILMGYLEDIAEAVSTQSHSLITEVLGSFGLEQADYEDMLTNPLFAGLVNTAMDNVAAMSDKERNRLIANKLMPKMLQSMAGLTASVGVSASDKIKAAAMVASVAGLTGGKDENAGVAQIQINIDSSYPMSGVTSNAVIEHKEA